MLYSYEYEEVPQVRELKESGENYLETILILTQKGQGVRSIDIADEMGFTKPSISRAVSILKGGGFIEVDANGYITLTEIGYELAERIYERHRVLTQFLVNLGVDETTAAEDACRIEHDISELSFRKIKEHMKI